MKLNWQLFRDILQIRVIFAQSSWEQSMHPAATHLIPQSPTLGFCLWQYVITRLKTDHL